MTMKEIRCSKLSRLMHCSGPLFLEPLYEEETGPAAAEGTAAGEYLELLLTQGFDAEPTFPTHAKNGVYFDNDMKFHTRPIAKEILARATSKVLCEVRVDWSTASGTPIRGQYDASYTTAESLVIDDLKYGWKLVEVKDNWQLLAYAIGEVVRRQVHFPFIELRIHQPRPHHEDGPTRSWILTYEELLSYKAKIDERMENIFVKGNRELSTGAHCKYCVHAAGSCPAFSRAFHSSVDYIINGVQQDNINETELASQLDLIARVDDILKIKKDSIQALAKDRIKNGKIIPGWSAEQSYGDRKWKSGVSPAAIEMLTGRRIVKEEMLSPAQAEKAGIPKEFIAGLVDRHFIGNKLVRKDGNAVGDKIFGKGAPK